MAKKYTPHELYVALTEFYGPEDPEYIQNYFSQKQDPKKKRKLADKKENKFQPKQRQKQENRKNEEEENEEEEEENEEDEKEEEEREKEEDAVEEDEEDDDPTIVKYIHKRRNMGKRLLFLIKDYNYNMNMAFAGGTVIDKSSQIVVDYDPVKRKVLVGKPYADGKYFPLWYPSLTVWKSIEKNGDEKYQKLFTDFVTKERQALGKSEAIWKNSSAGRFLKNWRGLDIGFEEQLYFKRPFLGIIPSLDSFREPLIIFQLEDAEFLKVKSIPNGHARGVTTLRSMMEGLSSAIWHKRFPPKLRFNIYRFYHFVKNRIRIYKLVLENAKASRFESAAFLFIYMGMKVKLDEIGEDMLIDNVRNLDEILNDTTINKFWLRSFDFEICDKLIEKLEIYMPGYEEKVRDVLPEIDQIIQDDKRREKRLFETCKSISEHFLAESRQRKKEEHEKKVLARDDPFKESRERRRDEIVKQLSSSASRPKPSLMNSLLDSVKTLPGKPSPY